MPLKSSTSSTTANSSGARDHRLSTTVALPWRASSAPQCAQNFASARLDRRHRPHTTDRFGAGCPHEGQKLLDRRTRAPQCGHCVVKKPIG